MNRSSKLSFAFVVLVACGGSGDDASEPDAGSNPPAAATAFAVGTDYFTAGIASTIAVPCGDCGQSNRVRLYAVRPARRRASAPEAARCVW